MTARPTFQTTGAPLLTCMVQAETPERIKELITLSRPEGAEAFGMQFCKLAPEYRTRGVYRDLFSFAAPQPVYVTNYAHSHNEKKSDDTLAEELLELAECGAALCDVMGDLFRREPDQLTCDPGAIRAQTELIDAIHARGAKVLISSHTGRFTPAERVLEIAREQERRGADVCKIVTVATTMAEQIEAMRIADMLKEALHTPFLFLTGGECRILRRVAWRLGNCMTLCVHEYDALATEAQPLLRDMKKIQDLL